MLGIVLYVLIITALVIGILRMPALALAPMLCMFGLEQWAQSMHKIFTQHQSFTNILVGVLVLLGLGVVIKQRNGDGYYPPVAYAILALFLYAMVSTAWAPRTDISVNLWLRNGPYLLTFIGLSPFLISGTRTLRQSMSGVLVLGATIVLLTLLYSDWHRRFIVLQGVYGNTGGNPLAIAQMAGYVVLAAMLLDTRILPKLQWMLRWGIVGAGLIVIVKSGSRGQFLGLMGVAALFGYLKIQTGRMTGRIMAIFVLSIFAGISAWVFMEYSEATRWTLEGLGESGEGRIGKVSTLLSHWYSTPMTMLFGLGNSASYDPDIIGIYPHLVAVEVLCEEGVVGALIYVTILYLTGRSLRKLFMLSGHDQKTRSLVALLGAWFVFDFVLTLKQGSLLTHYDIFALAIIIGRYELFLDREKSVSTDKQVEPVSYTNDKLRILAPRKSQL